jgi:hypothetical protein
MAIISDFDSEDPGSIPGAASFFKFCLQACFVGYCPQGQPFTNLFSFFSIAEVEGDLYETCAVSEYPDYRVYMPFLYCLSLSYRSIPLNVQSCATTHGLDYNVLTVSLHWDPDRVLLHRLVAHL